MRNMYKNNDCAAKYTKTGGKTLACLYCSPMLFFHTIALTQFRNYARQQFSFKQRIVGICGINGSGKTNLLDAVYYTCFTKSYFTRPDSQNVTHGLQGLRIDAAIENNGEPFNMVCILRENNRKELQLNGVPYTRFSDHIGKFPCVMVAPDDVALITDGSEERRKFVDTILSQLNPGYLRQLIDYTKILQQRNSLLKAAAERNYLDITLLDILDGQLAEKAEFIFSQRQQFLQGFLPIVTEQYRLIAGKDDGIAIVYESQLQQAGIRDLLLQNRQRDLYTQRTSTGIHKDDLVMQMQREAFKTLASQGQRKSLLFALKLAEFITLKQYKGFAPVLLLDDVFEKLDAQRMHNLLQRVCVQEQGQVFITDTHPQRLKAALDALGEPYELIELG
jgi:DNA replication and repair protein RecF